MGNFSSYSYNKKALLEAIDNISDSDRSRLKKALLLAEQYHAGQKRDEIDPENAGYVIHPVRAALWLIKEKRANTDMVVATLLHDTLEDTKLSPEKIKSEFGTEVLKLVQSVTRPRPANESEEEKLVNKPAHLNKILQGSLEAKLLKTADWLDNIRSWKYIPSGHPSRQKFPRWINEVNNFYVPIAESVSKKAAREMKEITTNLP
jgi:GTP pyrophosphokinase